MANTQKTAIVTGGSQGIGATLVKAFLDRGYNVVANCRNITKSGAFEEGLKGKEWVIVKVSLKSAPRRQVSPGQKGVAPPG